MLTSLDEKPQKNWLRRIHECEDEKLLKVLLKENSNLIEKKNESELNYYGNVVKFQILSKKLMAII